jgi:uncharacterized damage-inducible protein DinB
VISRPGFEPARIYDYLLKAREKVLAATRRLSLAQYTQEFPFAHKSVQATLVHIAGAEWTYNRRLRGEEIPPPADRPFTRFSQTEFAPLEAAWKAQGEETKRTLGEIADWSRPIEYVVTPPPGGTGPFQRPTRIRTTAGGFATQLIVHEVHHRAQVMAMLRQLGAVVEVVDYSALMFERTEVAE